MSLGFTREEIAKYYYGTPQNVSQNTQSIPKLNPQPSTQLPPINNPNIPDDETRMKARNYIQTVYESQDDVSTPELKPINNPNIPDNDTRMQARNFIQAAYNGDIDENGALVSQNKPSNDSSRKKTTQNKSTSAPFSTKEDVKPSEKEITKEDVKTPATNWDDVEKAKKIGNYYAQKEAYKAKYATTSKYAEQKKKYEDAKKQKALDRAVQDMPQGTTEKLMAPDVQQSAKQALLESGKNRPSKKKKEKNADNYVVSREKYDELMKNKELAYYIDTLEKLEYQNADQDATVSPEWADTIGAKNITGGYTKDEFYDLLHKKFNYLNKQDLKDMAFTRHSDLMNEETAQYGEELNELGNKHPVLGSAASMLGTLGGAVEGAYNVAAGGLTGDDRFVSNMFRTQRNAPREGVKENLNTEIGKGAYDIGMGLGDMGVGVLTGSAPMTLAGNTANEAMQSAHERGSGTRKSALYGGVSGAADYFFNKIGLDKARSLAMDSITSSGLKSFLAKNAVAGLGEAGENVLQDVAQTFADNLINGKNSELRQSFDAKLANGEHPIQALNNVAREYEKQLLLSGATGFAMGSAMQGIPTIANGIAAKAFNEDLNSNSRKILQKVEDYKNSKNAIPLVDDTPTDITQDLPTNRLVENAPQNNADRANLAQNNVVNEIPTMRENAVNEPLNDSASVTETITPTDVNDSEPLRVATEAVNHRQLNANMNSLLNMFGRRSEENIGQLRALLNEYAQTGDENTIKEARSLAKEIDKEYDGAKYTSKKGTVTEYGYGNFGKFSDQVDMFQNALKNQSALSKTSLTPGMEDLNGRINDLFSRYDLSDDVSKDIRKWKQSIKNLANETNGDNFDNYFDATSKLFDDIRESKEFVSSYRGKVKANDFDVPEYMAINDAIEDMYRNKSFPKSMAEDIGLKNDNTLTVDMSDIPPMDETDITSGNEKHRRVITNSAQNAGIITDADIEADPELKAIRDYEEHSNKRTYKQALNDVENNRSQFEQEYMNGDRAINTDLDVDRGMIILKRMANEIGESDNPQAIIAKRNAILRNMATNGTEAGQFIQAFAKYANTPEDALVKAEKLDMENVERWGKRNKKAKETNEKLANALRMQGYDGSMDADPQERPGINVYRNQVRNTLAREFGSINKQFTDADVDYLANLIEQGATTKELTDALNTKMATGKWGISAETQAKVNDIFDYIRQFDENSKDFVEGQAEAFRLLAEEVAPKATPMEKFDAWRYIAMLGNPKTMLRNYVGNKMFGTVVGASNTLSAALEGLADKAYHAKTGNHIQRQKAVLNPIKDKPLIDASFNDAVNKRFRQIEGSKYEKPTRDAIAQVRSPFESRLMRFIDNAVDAGISDTKAVEKKYSTSLAGYLKANGYDASVFDAQAEYDALNRAKRDGRISKQGLERMEDLEPTVDFLEKARDYALSQAEYATFHEDNKVADWLSKASREAPGVGRFIIEGVVPFKKTPANILRSGFEYSPFGALKSIKETGKLIYENTGSRKGNLEDTYTKNKWFNGKEVEVKKSLASDVIDSWSKTLTGSALTGLGYYLFNKGILTSSNKDEKYQDQLEGIQNYGININGHTYSLDWAAPGVMPLLLGAEVNKVLKANAVSDKEWYQNLDAWVSSLNAILDPMFETSMLSGIKDTFETAANEIRYNEEGAVGGILGSLLGNSATGYLTQAIPTVSGQLARTIDPIRRTTDTASEGFLEPIEKQGRKIMNKIPFLSMLNPEYRDARGERQYNSPFPVDYEKDSIPSVLGKTYGNFMYQTLSPGYYSRVNTTDADRMARDTYNALDESGNPIKDSKVFADWKSTKKINGEKLNPYQMQDFRESMGKANTAMRDAIASEDWFNELSGTEQTEILKKLNSVSEKIGQYTVAPDSVNIKDELETYVNAGEGQDGLDAIVKELKYKYNPYGIKASKYAELVESGATKQEFEKAVEEAKEEAEKAEVFKELGMTSATKSFEAAYENDQMDLYEDYRKYLKDNNLRDSEEHWGDYLRQRGIQPAFTGAESFGQEKKESWNRVKKDFPDMTEEEFSKTFDEMDRDGYGSITQDEFIRYLIRKKYTKEDEAEAQELAKAYGGWQKIPVLENKKWKFKKKK